MRDAWILDVPCGAGRLFPGLAGRARRVVGLDVSREMLCGAPAVGASGVPLVCGDVLALPFGDRSFDAVVCCRLLHHLADAAELAAVARELVRVSRGVVVASFWDRASLPALGRRLTGRGAGKRRAHKKALLVAAFAGAGADVVAFAHSFRGLSQQTFLLARRRR